MKFIQYTFLLSLIGVCFLSYSQNTASLYNKEAVGITKDNLVRGGDKVLDLAKKHYKDGDVKEAESLYNVSVLNKLNYEIAVSPSDKKNTLVHLLIWQDAANGREKLLEVLHKRSKEVSVAEGIEEARKKWMKHCNHHDVEKLVTELYTDDAIYFNRGRILRGHDDLTKEYSYMGNASYGLRLTPKHVEMVSEDMAFEIGMCSGSYNLPYMLVWKKIGDEWKVYFDSNY